MLRNLNILKGIFLASAALAVALGLMPPNTALAQWTNDPWNGMVNVCDATGDQDHIKICSLAGNNTMVAWTDERTSPQLIYCQVLNSMGNTLLPANGVPILEGNWMLSWGTGGTLVSDGEGGCIAIFSDYRNSVWYRDVYGQRFDSLGNRLWGDIGLPLVIWPGQQEVIPKDIAFDSLGNFFVAWDVSVEPGNSDTYVQKFNTTGQCLWGDYGAPASNNSIDQGSPQIVADGQGGVLDVWQQGPEPDHFYFQHLDPNGNPWPGLPANGVPVYDMSQQPMATSLWDGVTDGEGGGVWCNWGAGGPNNYLYLFRLNGQGRTQWVWSNFSYCQHEFKNLLHHPIDSSIWLDVKENASGTWSSNLYSFNHAGHPLFGNEGVPYGGNALVLTSDGVISAEDIYTTPSVRILARKTNFTGLLDWQSDVAMSSSGWVFAYPVGSPDGVDGVVLAFADARNMATASNISAQRVLANGAIGNPTPNPRKPDIPSIKLDVAGEVVTYTLPQSGVIRLELYDLLGRKLSTLLNDYRTEGTFILPLNFPALPTGMYFLQLTSAYTKQTVKVILTK